VILFPAAGDPHCAHHSHYECVACRKMVCARCGAELAASTSNWKTIDCRERKTEVP